MTVYIQTYIIDHFKPSVRITTQLLKPLMLYALQFKVDAERQTFEKLFMAIFFIARNLLRASHRRNIFILMSCNCQALCKSSLNSLEGVSSRVLCRMLEACILTVLRFTVASCWPTFADDDLWRKRYTKVLRVLRILFFSVFQFIQLPYTLTRACHKVERHHAAAL